jgi:hypothetical protein
MPVRQHLQQSPPRGKLVARPSHHAGARASLRVKHRRAGLPEWQTVVACLIGAAEGRDFMMHARIGMLRALNRNVVREFDSSRKEPQWGPPQAEERPMTIVWIYVDTNKEIGDRDHLKVFATPELAKEWIKENDQEGVMFGYEVIEE